jgi:hypothetical protein
VCKATARVGLRLDLGPGNASRPGKRVQGYKITQTNPTQCLYCFLVPQTWGFQGCPASSKVLLASKPPRCPAGPPGVHSPHQHFGAVGADAATDEQQRVIQLAGITQRGV